MKIQWTQNSWNNLKKEKEKDQIWIIYTSQHKILQSYSNQSSVVLA